jgi:phosphoribosylamine--glycine ligase
VNILVIGGGAREHAICRALRDDPTVTTLHCAPGNAGIAAIAETSDVDGRDADAVARLATKLKADLVVIGPEIPLVAGVVDEVQAHGIACFGPTQAAAQLEGSKAFAKEIMNAADVPTAASRVCTDARQAAAALDEFGPPYVVKDDGLAAGKGVVVTLDRSVALEHASHCARVVIEEYLDGPEVSLFAITDGTTVVPLLPVQDFKRVADDDQGPNTGGMGAYAPLPWVPRTLVDEVMRDVLQPTVNEMRRRGTPFAGLLYAGLALTSRGTRVVEFNARFGDPETQVVLALLETPLAGLLNAAATGTLADHPHLRWRDGYAITVVVAAAGYPESPRSGDVIGGLDQVTAPAYVLHAGTRTRDGETVSAGGRVLSVTATGDTLAAARGAAYTGVANLTLDGGHHRSDIALLAVRGEIELPPPGPR